MNKVIRRNTEFLKDALERMQAEIRVIRGGGSSDRAFETLGEMSAYVRFIDVANQRIDPVAKKESPF